VLERAKRSYTDGTGPGQVGNGSIFYPEKWAFARTRVRSRQPVAPVLRPALPKFRIGCVQTNLPVSSRAARIFDSPIGEYFERYRNAKKSELF
jgi:hypothetical protein